jgi:hypothetical protein
MEDAMHVKGNGGRRAAALFVSIALLTGAIAMGASAPAFGVAQPATGLSAFVNGTELHVHAVQLPPKVADLDEAFAVSLINSAGFVKDKAFVNEVNEGIIPPAGKNAYARGGGAEVGLAEPTPNDAIARLLELSTAESSAPTAAPPYTSGLIDGVVNTVDLSGALDPLANASALGGRAATLWNPNYLFPALGNPLTYAYGQAADAQALNTASDPSLDALSRFISPVLSTNSDPNNPDRSVASSQTFTYLVNNGDGTCGLASEVHMSIAPVNIAIAGLLIEVGGDWLMKSVATGKSTGNSFTYGPDPVSNPANTPLIRVIDTTTNTVLGELNTQQILQGEGLVLPSNPLIDLAIGENARAIAPPAADGTPGEIDADSTATHNSTTVSAAADVLRLRLLQGVASPFQLADLRLGHFEMKVSVPTGGVNCEIPVAKTSSVPVANAGEAMTFNVKVPTSPNAVRPFPCDLANVTVTDVLSVEKATDPAHPPKMNILSGKGPKGEVGKVAADGQSIVFSNTGPWKPGTPALLYTIEAVVASDSGVGIMKDTATAVASAANCSGKNSILGSVIGLITGDATGVGNGLVEGSSNFFGSNGTGLTGNIRGGGPVKIRGNGNVAGPKVTRVQDLKLPPTGLNDGPRLALAFVALLSTAVLIRARRRVTLNT